MDKWDIGAVMMHRYAALDEQAYQQYTPEADIFFDCIQCFCYAFGITFFDLVEYTYY